MGTVLLVTSGKGGVGKTTSTAALGAELEVGSMIDGEQIQRARKLLGWSPSRLAQRARTITATGVKRAESYGPITDAQLQAIQLTLEAAGIEFVGETRQPRCRGQLGERPRRAEDASREGATLQGRQ